MFLEALFMIVKKWKQSKCPSSNEWIFYTHMMEYYWGIQRNEVLIQATIWMNFFIMLSKTLC